MSDSEIARKMFLFNSAAATASANDRVEVQLVERFRAGDKEAFGEIYRMFAPLVHGVVLARVPQDDVQDIVQEVFLAAYNSLHTLREKRLVSAWLTAIARNRAAEFYRRARPTEELSDEIHGKSSPNAEAREVLNAIRALPAAYRETMVLRLVEGLTGNEIAEQTGLKPESVRVNLHRGMELLRKKLGIGGGRK
ncbi:MAG: sigma-70 family RNA polymerase sigma factor [Acidobacteriota bacterium]